MDKGTHAGCQPCAAACQGGKQRAGHHHQDRSNIRYCGRRQKGVYREDGLIIGKMGHTERYEENIFKNIDGNKYQALFDNAVAYFNKRK